MNTYTITSPSIEGVISDDCLYFEGIRRPPAFFTVRDSGTVGRGNIIILEQYLDDIHQLFMKKLGDFIDNNIDNAESLKLQALLQEMIKVKDLIENAPKADIMRE